MKTCEVMLHWRQFLRLELAFHKRASPPDENLHTHFSMRLRHMYFVPVSSDFQFAVARRLSGLQRGYFFV